MKTNTGWIKLYRSLWDQEQSADPVWVAVWVYLLTHAAHKETEVTFKGVRTPLKPGQLIITVRALELAIGIKRDRICRYLSTMIDDRLITKRSDRRFTFITVLEWDSYQGAVGQDSETEQEEKKKKKVKSNQLVADNPPSVDEIASYVEDKGLNVDSSKFWNYYETADWTIEVNGKNPRPMKNWKTVARGWSERNGETATKSNGATRIDYSRVMKEVKVASR